MGYEKENRNLGDPANSGRRTYAFGYVCKRINDKINCFSCPERGKIRWGNSWDQVFLRDEGSKFTAILGSGIKKLSKKTGSV